MTLIMSQIVAGNRGVKRSHEYEGYINAPSEKFARTMPRSRYVPRSRLRIRRSRRRRSYRRPYKLPLFQPYQTFRRLRNTYVVSLDPAASGAIATNILKLNSAYDPQGNAGGSGGTGQGMGYDSLENLYHKYCVVSYRITVEAVSTDNTYPIAVGFCPCRDSSPLSSFTQYKEMPGNVQRIMTPDIDKIVFNNSGSIKKWMLPRRANLYSDDLLASTTNSDPSRVLYGHLYCQSLEGSADVAQIRLIVTMDQFVRFYEPKVQARSTQ